MIASSSGCNCASRVGRGANGRCRRCASSLRGPRSATGWSVQALSCGVRAPRESRPPARRLNCVSRRSGSRVNGSSLRCSSAVQVRRGVSECCRRSGSSGMGTEVGRWLVSSSLAVTISAGTTDTEPPDAAGGTEEPPVDETTTGGERRAARRRAGLRGRARLRHDRRAGRGDGEHPVGCERRDAAALLAVVALLRDLPEPRSGHRAVRSRERPPPHRRRHRLDR